MTNPQIIDNLTAFGLSRQEALIYTSLLTHGQMTGYEISKDTGISRSNIYGSIIGLVDKGGAYTIEGDPTKYTPVDIQTFTQNTLAALQKKADFLKQNAPKKIEQTEGYITISGYTNISNKIRSMLSNTKLRLYFSAPSLILNQFIDEILNLCGQDIKLIILTDNGFNLNKFQLDNFNQESNIIYTETEPGQLRLITDSSYVLTGELNGNDNDTCLYSGQQHLVKIMKEALANKIKLLDK